MGDAREGVSGKESGFRAGDDLGGAGISAGQEYKYDSGATYKGEWADRKRHGHGTLTKPTGEKYVGDWADNAMHGRGTLTWPEGTKYEGDFRNGAMHGKGKYTYEASSYYEGDWVEDAKQGQGRMVYPNGDVYEGGWKASDKDGYGKYTQVSTGIEFHGMYRGGKRVGYGVQKQGGKCYEVKSDGTTAVASVAISDADFRRAVDALKSGGTFTSQLEEKLAGLEPGLQYRVYTYPKTGAVYEGTWKGVARHGKGEWKHPEGDSYQGQYSDNKEHGWGVYVYAKSGKKYCGQFSSGAQTGFGVYLFVPSGAERFEGGYLEDKRHGWGLYTFESGDMRFQNYNRGTMVEERAPTRADLDGIRESVLDAIENLRKWAPGHLDFLETEWMERAERWRREDQAASDREAAEALRKKREAEEAARRKAQDEADRAAREKADRDAEAKRRQDERDAEAKRKADADAAAARELADRQREMEEKRRAAEEARRRAEEEAARKPKEIKTFAYELLKLPGSKLTRDEVDYTRREMHLSDVEFKRIFGMDKETFQAQPQWKIDGLRKQHGLY